MPFAAPRTTSMARIERHSCPIEHADVQSNRSKPISSSSSSSSSSAAASAAAAGASPAPPAGAATAPPAGTDASFPLPSERTSARSFPSSSDRSFATRSESASTPTASHAIHPDRHGSASACFSIIRRRVTFTIAHVRVASFHRRKHRRRSPAPRMVSMSLAVGEAFPPRTACCTIRRCEGVPGHAHASELARTERTHGSHVVVVVVVSRQGFVLSPSFLFRPRVLFFFLRSFFASSSFRSLFFLCLSRSSPIGRRRSHASCGARGRFKRRNVWMGRCSSHGVGMREEHGWGDTIDGWIGRIGCFLSFPLEG